MTVAISGLDSAGRIGMDQTKADLGRCRMVMILSKPQADCGSWTRAFGGRSRLSFGKIFPGRIFFRATGQLSLACVKKAFMASWVISFWQAASDGRFPRAAFQGASAWVIARNLTAEKSL